MKIYEIIWVDSVGADGWVSKESVKEQEISTITTVGYLIAETTDSITLTMADTTLDECGAYMVIPKFAIKKKRLLK